MAITFKKRTVYHSLRLFIKNLVPLCGSVMLAIAGKKTNRSEGYEKRVLILFGGGIGDVVKRTVIKEPIRQYLANYEVHYLSPYDLPLPGANFFHTFKYSKAKTNPFYYFSLVNELRTIGFSRVIVLLPLWEGFLFSLGVDMRPETLYCDGMNPPDDFARLVERLTYFLHKKTIKNCVKIIKTEDGAKSESELYAPSDVWRMTLFISRVISEMEPRYAFENLTAPLSYELYKTELEVDRVKEGVYMKALCEKYNFNIKKYCVIALGSSDVIKDWPPEYFAKIADFLAQAGLTVILVGVDADRGRATIFNTHCGVKYIDLVGKSPLREVLFLINNCTILISNDTSYVHIAVALAAPSVCMIGWGNKCIDSDYGYRGINRWVLPRTLGERVEKVLGEDVQEAIVDVLGKKRDSAGLKIKFEMSYHGESMPMPKEDR